MRLAAVVLAVCAAFVAPAASRQLKQTGNSLDFPGCTFFGDSEVFQNPDFSSLAAALRASGLNDTLSNLSGYHILFAPTNDAFAEFLAAANITVEDALSSNLNEIVLASHVVPGTEELLVSSCRIMCTVCCFPACRATVFCIVPSHCISARQYSGNVLS